MSNFEGILLLLRTTGSGFVAAFPLECVELNPRFPEWRVLCGHWFQSGASRRTPAVSKRNINRTRASRQTNPFFGFDRFALQSSCRKTTPSRRLAFDYEPPSGRGWLRVGSGQPATCIRPTRIPPVRGTQGRAASIRSSGGPRRSCRGRACIGRGFARPKDR